METIKLEKSEIESRIDALVLAIYEIRSTMKRFNIVEGHIEYASYANAIDKLYALKLELMAQRRHSSR
jgi:hypothetical protein